MKRKWVCLILLLLAILIVSCSALEDDATTSNKTYNMGDWMEVGDYDVMVHDMVTEDVVDGKYYVMLDVEYANNRSDEELSCRENQWILFDTDNYTYEVKTARYIYEDYGLTYMGSERFLTKGSHLRGWLAFELPQTAKINRIQFFNAFLGTKTGEILIAE